MSDWLHYLSDENFDCWGGQRKITQKSKFAPKATYRAGQPRQKSREQKKVNFLVSNKKCKCCESVKRTMGKWGRTKQNKTVKEGKEGKSNEIK